MSEEAELRIRLNGEEYTATRLNTTLFTYAGELAIYNHVFFVTEEDEDNQAGAYLFCDFAAYEAMAKFVEQHRFPRVLDRNEVPQCDLSAWDNAHLGDLGDFIPEQWEGPDGTD